MSEERNAGYGQQSPYDTSSEFNAKRFMVEQMIGRLSTNKVVEVLAVYRADGTTSVQSADTGVVGPAGYVDVKILVNQVDGAGQNVEHGVIYNVPFGRGQGGSNGIICDPQVGDVGVMACADRDISSVKANRGGAQAPGSYRRLDAADGMYTCSLLSRQPTQYVRFHDKGMDWIDKNGNKFETNENGTKVTDKFGNVIETTETGVKITDTSGNTLEMKSGEIEATAATFRINGSLVVSGGLSVDGAAVILGEVTGGPSGVGLTTHVHEQGNDSHNDTEVPTDSPTPGS